MKVLYTFIFFLFTYCLFAQEIKVQAPWQQQANYTISVTLNDDSNYLTGFETIEYFNNSPNALKEIYIHLFPNAYKDNSTAFAREKIAQGDTKFWMADNKDRGYITNLNFMSDGQALPLAYNKTSPDNARLILQQPLAAGRSIKITTPFVVKIPYTFSRLGHVGHSYQISQWFPKIAVYDVNGWNQIPYLDQGEFYSDYGNYDVSITLPKNYLVAATGNLQNETEMEWLKNRAMSKLKKTDEFDAKEIKTLHYTENNIHDFAFFADKRWCVAMEDVILPSGKNVTAWAFDTVYDEAANGVKYIKKTLLYLSAHVGEYPYNTAKSCTGALVAGAGMEYPTVTIVGQQHESEVVHEVGHNWFYGILGSNERRSPWMDEGINTFYQLQICEEKQNATVIKAVKRMMGNDFEFNEENVEWMLGKINSSRGEDAPITLDATRYSVTNYAVLVYYRTALNFNYLKAYLGADTFDSCMKNYYETWHYKHPLPGDIKNCFEKTSGKKLGWFFDGMINENQNYDVAITKIIKEDKNEELEIHLKNKSGKAIAIPLKASNNSTSNTFWLEPFAHDTIIHIHNAGYTLVELNDKPYFVETNINNNYYFLDKRNPQSKPLQLRPALGLENKYHRTLFLSPITGRNAFNKYMVGIEFNNSTLVRRKFEFLVAPLYSFQKGNINGYTNISYTFMPRAATINTWNLGVKGAKFNSIIGTSPIVYIRLQPYMQLNFTRPTNGSRLERFIRMDYTQVMQNREHVSDSFQNNTTHYLNLQYSLNNNTVLNPYKFKIMAEKNLGNANNDYWKVSLKAQYKLSYDNPKKYLSIDFFMGEVFYNKTNAKEDYAFYLAGENPSNDYKYWHAIINRDPTQNTHQIFNEQGGMRSNVIPVNTSNIAATLRFRSHLPFTNLLRPYLDMGSYKGIQSVHQTKILYTTGISLVLIEDAIEINFPLAFTHSYEVAPGVKQYEVSKNFLFTQSKAFNDAISANGLRYWQTVTFLLNLDKLNPIYWVRNFPLGK
jgi:hypothetical protein